MGINKLTKLFTAFATPGGVGGEERGQHRKKSKKTALANHNRGHALQSLRHSIISAIMHRPIVVLIGNCNMSHNIVASLFAQLLSPKLIKKPHNLGRQH